MQPTTTIIDPLAPESLADPLAPDSPSNPTTAAKSDPLFD